MDIEKILSKLTKLSVVPIQSSAMDEDIRLYVKSRMVRGGRARREIEGADLGMDMDIPG